MHVTFVGTGPYYRLPEILARPGVRITVVGNRRHPLRASRYVDRFVELDHRDAADLPAALIERQDVIADLGDWTIVADDNVLRGLATSALAERDKLRLLPVRQAAGLELLGSKIGLDALCRRAGVVVPPTRVVRTPDGLPEAREGLGGAAGRVLVKADEGWGGDRVRFLLPGEDDVPDSWFPVVAQRFIPGPEADVDALFRDGRLVAWTYSHVVAATSATGPSAARLYRRPPSDDFLADLTRVGEAGGLHGFFNGSLIWSPAQRRHYLFELDGRPNAWVQFGPRLGVDWARAMAAANPGTRGQVLGPRGYRIIRLYPRAIVHALDQRDWSGLRPWALALPGTWDTRNARDRAANAVERSDAVRAASHWARLSVAVAAVAAWRRTPSSVAAVADVDALRRLVDRVVSGGSASAEPV